MQLPKRLEESATKAAEKFQRSEEFEVVVVLWSFNSQLTVLKRKSKDNLKVDANFLLDQLPSMKDFLALQAREAEAGKAVKDEDSGIGSSFLEEVTSPSSPKCTPPS